MVVSIDSTVQVIDDRQPTPKASNASLTPPPKSSTSSSVKTSPTSNRTTTTTPQRTPQQQTKIMKTSCAFRLGPLVPRPLLPPLLFQLDSLLLILLSVST